MKGKLSRVLRSGLSLMLVFCMLISMAPAAFAVESKETINYVSLGDSMSNGYGLQNYANQGHNAYGEGAYPLQFEAWLEANGYEVNHSKLAVSALRAEDLHWILEYPNGYKGDQYTVNGFINGRFNGENDFANVAAAANEYQNAVKGADIISVGTGNANFGVFMLNSIMEAAGALGDSSDGYAWVKFEDALVGVDADTKAFALQAYDMIKKELLAEVPAASEELVGKIADRMAYVVVSYIINYEGALDAIATLNPDAEVIIVGLMNNMTGVAMDCTVDGEKFVLPLGDVMNTVIECMNGYLAGLPAVMQANGKYAGNTFYFAANPNVEVIANVLDKKMMQDATSVARERTITAIVDLIWPILNENSENAADKDAPKYVDINKEDIAAYEELNNDPKKVADWARKVGTDKAVSVVTYVAFENAAIAAVSVDGNLNGDALLNIMDMDALAESFDSIYDAFDVKVDDLGRKYTDEQLKAVVIEKIEEEAQKEIQDNYQKDAIDRIKKVAKEDYGYDNLSDEIILALLAGEIEKAAILFVKDEQNLGYTYDEIEGFLEQYKANPTIVIPGIDIAAIESAVVSNKAEFEKALADVKASVEKEIADKIAEVLPDAIDALRLMLVMPEAMTSALLANKDMASLLSLFARMMIGDGIGCHPSLNGHNALSAAVIKAYAEKHTVQDQTKENVEIMLNELYKLMETYGPEVAAQVWAQWVEHGYVDMVNASIEEMTSTLSARYDYYTNEALPAINNSIAVMNQQKDALAAELATLQVELAAKKAELEKVIADREFGEIYNPDINIDVELGGNGQTIVPDHECVVDGDSIEAELKAAIADLEHAIAVIEALIADIEADIVDMIALAEQIAAAVAELEKTMVDVAEAGEELAKAIEEIAAILKDSNGVVESVMASYKAARATALAALEALELTNGIANEMIADIDGMITKICTDAEALYNKFVSELPGCIDQIPEEAKLLLGASVLAVKTALEANKEEIQLALDKTLKELEDQYNIDAAEIQAKIDELTKVYNMDKAEIEAELKKLADEYGVSEEKIVAELEKIEAEIQAKVEAEVQKQIDALKTEAEAKLAAKQAELDALYAQLEAAAEDKKAEIQAQINCVIGDMEIISADLECAISHVENVTSLEIRKEIEKLYEAKIAELKAQLEELKKFYEQARKELNDELAALIATYEFAVENLEKDKADLWEAYKKAVDEAEASADKAIAALVAKAEAELAELGRVGEELSKALDGIYAAIHDELSAAQVAIDKILKGQLTAVEDLAAALEALVSDETMNEIVGGLTAQVNSLLKEATTADMIVDDDFMYVAIGDGSATAEGYAENLRDALNEEAAENGVDAIDFVNYAKIGNTVAAERANLSDVADADLITIGFSNVTFLAQAYENAMADEDEMVDLDWSKVVGPENVALVEDLLADVAVKLEEAGISGEYGILLNTIIEAYAYSAVQYATELPELINEIHAINPDAVVVIVGNYNPMDGVTIVVEEGVTLNLGEYIDYLVDGAAIHGIAYALLSGNAIYVDAREVETQNTKTELSLLNLLKMGQKGFAALYPNDAGDDNIASCIANALNITYVKSEVPCLLGDVNDDGKVDGRDVVRLKRYAGKLPDIEIHFLNSDVNLDGIVDGRDVLRLSRYVAKIPGVELG